ncbi:MAG: ATP synthase subunit delta [Acidimicrobiia bacterium]
MTAEGSKVDAYARAILAIARVENRVAPVEDDLFRFARVLEGSDPLRVALTDPQLPVERRLAVIDELTSGKALPLSGALLGMLVGAGQVNDLAAIVDRFVELAAAEREREVAEVRSAIELDEGQVARLAEALGRATGKTVEVKVIVDPSVLGGLVARIGDTVIDGSVRHRLDQMKAQL